MKTKFIVLSLLVLALPCAPARAEATFSRDVNSYVATDLVSQILYPKVKLVTGADGQALPVSSSNPIPVTITSGGSTGKASVATVRNVYSSVNVTTGAWVQLVASLPQDVTEIAIFDSSGQTLELGTGGSGSETRKLLIFPGGNGQVPLGFSSGTRISIRAVSATAATGEIDINFLQ